MIELTILGVAFSLLLFYGVPVSFCIGIATLLALFIVTPDVTSALVVSAHVSIRCRFVRRLCCCIARCAKWY